ncbi:MAG: IS630 family transposase [Elusimicrobia bacterium]|nr:IS630 family transposase [Elusimicrobiota bacterium]
MRPPGTAQQLAARRLHAIKLLKKGQSLSAVARALSSSVSSVFRWWQAFRKKGANGLRPVPASGRPPKLTPAQKRKLMRILSRNALAVGYATDLWTLGRIAEVTRQHFGVDYHPCHIWKLLRGLGWSCQKPETRARERDEEAIERWKRYRWPHIIKGQTTWGPSRLSRRERVPPVSQRS